MKKIVLCCLLAAASTVHAAPNFSLPNGPGPYSVGLHIVQQYDFSRAYKGLTDATSGQPVTGERARPVQTLIWYPANKGGTPLTYFDYVATTSTEETYGLPREKVLQAADEWVKGFAGAMTAGQIHEQTAGRMTAVLDARPVQGKFPLVVYAPSFSAAAHENADLCEYLASQGYVVIASPDMGSHSRPMTKDLDGIEAQAGDIEFLIGYAHTLPQADTAHIAVVGYSWGGISNVFAAAKDSRINALVDLDGSVRYFPKLVADARYVTPARVAVPMLYLASSPRSMEQIVDAKFDMTSSFLNDMKYSDMYKATMYPMEHANFSSTFLRFDPPSSSAEYSREEVLQAYSWMTRYVQQFLNAYLKGDATSLAFLKNPPVKNGAPAHMMSMDVRLATGTPPTMEAFAAELARRGFEHAFEVYQDMQKKNPGFKPEEDYLNHWGYALLGQKKNAEAIAIFTLATTIYPESGNAFDSLGEAYERNHENALSIKNYQRSLELSPDNLNAVEHLKAMGAK